MKFLTQVLLMATVALALQATDPALIEIPKHHPGTQVKNNGLILSIKPCSYQECRKQFRNALKSVDELEEQYVVLKVAITNTTDTRYMLHNRTFSLPTVGYETLTNFTANKKWWDAFATETALNAFDIAIIPVMVYLLIEKEKWFQNYAGALSLFGGFSALKTFKERKVRALHKEEEETKARLKLIEQQLRTPSPLADHAIIEPHDTTTKLVIIERAHYQEDFTVSLMSHDFTATPHTLDFSVTLPLDKLKAVALLKQQNQ